MKHRYLFLAFIISTAFRSDFTLVRSIPAKATFITTDNLGDLYIIKEDILEKYDENGNLLKSFSNKSFGKISSVDAGNPMKMLVFYKDFSKIIFLDNTLSQNSDAISLEELGYFQVPLACSSHNNGIWIYNPQNFELVRLDENLKKQQQTGNINQLTGQEIKPVALIEYDNRLYLDNPATGILVFDVYGTYSKTIPLKSVPAFQPGGDNVSYCRNNFIRTYNTKLLAEDSVALPAPAVSARTEKGKLYLQGESSVSIYSAK